MSERKERCTASCIQRAGARQVNPATLLALAAPLALMGCAGDKSILDPAGQVAREVALIWWVMLSFATVVFVSVVSLWLYALLRKHREHTPTQERRIVRYWIVGGGLLLPGLTICALLAFGVPTGKRVLPVPLDNAPVVIEVVGHQWWWEVRYPNAEGEAVVTANQIVMPAGEPVDFHVTAADVIHSFWIPRLGGKIDMLPGRTNRIRLDADAPGRLLAQSAEFSGVGYAHMTFPVEVLPREEFDAWLAARQPEAIEALTATADAATLASFEESCARCHRVAGLSTGDTGPDLSDIGARATLGGGVLTMEEGAIAHWLEHHQTLKPGNKMPPHDDMDAATLEALGSWLETLTP